MQGGKHRVGGGLSQRAQAVGLDVVAQLLHFLQQLRAAVAHGNLLQHLQQAAGADPAGGAFAAAFIHGKFQEELGDIHHAGVLVHDDQTAGAHHRTDGDQVVVVDGGIDERSRDAAAGGASGLRRLEFLAVRDAATDILDDLPQGGAHRDLHQAGVVDLAHQAEDLGALAALGAHAGKPVGAVEDDAGDIGPGLYVIQDGRDAEQALDCREGRTGTRLAAVPLDGGHQRGLLAADEGAGTQAQLDIKGKAGAEDILAQKAVFPRLLDGDLQAVNGDGIFGADVDVALVGADGIAGDGHGLQHHVGVALQHRTVHKGAGVALIGVAADVLHVARALPGKQPLLAGGEAAAAAAAQAAVLHDLDHLVGGHPGQYAAQRLVAVHRYVLVNIFGVDDAAVAQRHPGLLFVEFGVVQVLDGAVVHYRFLIQQAGHDTALEDMLLHDLGDILHRDVGIKAALRVNDHHRAQGAQAKAAGLDNLDLSGQPTLLQQVVERIDELLGMGGAAAGAAAHQDVCSCNRHWSLLLLFHIGAHGVFRYRGAVYQVLAYDARHLIGGHLYIGDLLLTGLEHLHDGLQLAHADASGLGHRHILQAAAVYLLHKGGKDGACPGRDAAGRHTDHHPGGIAVILAHCHAVFHPLPQGGQLFQRFHG